MDQIKTGKFIAELRKQANLTQEVLGEKIGVTNKTISRWENGNYMPDIEMLGILAKEFNVSINELLAGERLEDEEFRKKADENIVSVAKSSAFTLEERKAYFKMKWRKDHVALLVLLALVPVVLVVWAVVAHEPLLASIAPISAVTEYGWQNNRMMIYVENSLFGGKG